MRGWNGPAAWMVAGLGLIGLSLAAATALLAVVEEPKGWRMGVLASAFWLLVLAGGGLAVGGVVRAVARLGRRGAMLVAALAVLSFVLAVVLHNAIYAITGEEEGFFFILALFVSPVVLIAALVRAVVGGPGNTSAPPPVGGGRFAPRH